MARSERGATAVQRSIQGGFLRALELERETAKTCNLETALEKRYKAFRIMETRKRQGYPIPEYGVVPPKPTRSRFLKVEINMLTHIFCYLPRMRGTVLKFIFSPPGYFLLWLNSRRRLLRTALRDSLAALKRKFSGKEGLVDPADGRSSERSANIQR